MRKRTSIRVIGLPDTFTINWRSLWLTRKDSLANRVMSWKFIKIDHKFIWQVYNTYICSFSLKTVRSSDVRTVLWRLMSQLKISFTNQNNHRWPSIFCVNHRFSLMKDFIDDVALFIDVFHVFSSMISPFWTRWVGARRWIELVELY